MEYENETQANLFRIDYRNCVFIVNFAYSDTIKVTIHYLPTLALWAVLANGYLNFVMNYPTDMGLIVLQYT